MEQGRSLMKKLDNYLNEAIGNIREDREKAKELLQNLESTIANNTDNHSHKQIGNVAAKYLETLQRSNEQLVKIVALLQKKQSNNNLSEEDKDQIFDMIKGAA